MAIGGNFWYVSTWLFDDPNRYNSTIHSWIFNTELTNMKEGEIVYLTNYPDIKFARQSQEQVDYCKILERI